jgi:hypothetical protein
MCAAADCRAGDGEGAGGAAERGHLQAALGRLRQAAAPPGEAQARESRHVSPASTLQVAASFLKLMISVADS